MQYDKIKVVLGVFDVLLKAFFVEMFQKFIVELNEVLCELCAFSLCSPW